MDVSSCVVDLMQPVCRPGALRKRRAGAVEEEERIEGLWRGEAPMRTLDAAVSIDAAKRNRTLGMGVPRRRIQ
ncbi:hypothetical protein N6G06_17555 [Cupriavidus gilardii]|uniref:hypothetical protein n=1 Tax=Cupriavidus gilardii TaxID=82541 RepID=UPI0021C16622|nr:hypothetical protein [Cupriavidus gilardii]MCT9071325.1 hypothetical protein [Cupriavidus gilardii]MCT9073170.1 hypothetical protein [Cupriavidus gilardii]